MLLGAMNLEIMHIDIHEGIYHVSGFAERYSFVMRAAVMLQLNQW